MSDRLTPDLLSKCQGLYVPVSVKQTEVEGLVIETGEDFYVISFEEQYLDITHKIDLLVKRANDEQIAFLTDGTSGYKISKFVQPIVSFDTRTKFTFIQDGGYDSCQCITLRLRDGTHIILQHDATSSYPYNFRIKVKLP